MSIVTVTQSCAIKGCTHVVKTNADLADLHSRDFVLCDDCESAIVIDVMIAMGEDIGGIGQEGIKAFVSCFNGWKRLQMGIALAHRPQDLGFQIGHRRPTLSGN